MAGGPSIEELIKKHHWVQMKRGESLFIMTEDLMRLHWIALKDGLYEVARPTVLPGEIVYTINEVFLPIEVRSPKRGEFPFRVRIAKTFRVPIDGAEQVLSFKSSGWNSK